MRAEALCTTALIANCHTACPALVFGIADHLADAVQEKTMKKIRKEVELMGSIQDCGNVIGLHGVYEDDAQVYLVMELCSGGDLERVLEVSCTTYIGHLPLSSFLLRFCPFVHNVCWMFSSLGFMNLQERGPFSELQTALVLYECLKVIASCHVS
jgi:serine/threonine protein kinase